MNLYCTLAEAKRRIITSRSAPNRQDLDGLLTEYLYTVSRQVDDEFYSNRPLFAPWVEMRRFPVTSRNVDSSRLLFRFTGSLLDLTTVSASGTALTLSTHVTPYPDSTQPPFHQLLLRDGASISSWYSNCSSTDYDRPAWVDITGIWGVHRRYSAAWKTATTLAAAIANTTTTTFTLTAVNGANWMGIAPAISVGSIFKIDSEIFHAISVNEAAETVTVDGRGANGSTAATHDNGATVYTWEVENPVRQAVARQVGLMLARDGAYSSLEITEAGAVRYPSGWLAEVRNAMDRYAYDY